MNRPAREVGGNAFNSVKITTIHKISEATSPLWTAMIHSFIFQTTSMDCEFELTNLTIARRTFKVLIRRIHVRTYVCSEKHKQTKKNKKLKISPLCFCNCFGAFVIWEFDELRLLTVKIYAPKEINA